MAMVAPPEVAEAIERFLATGRYKDADDVLRKALDALQSKLDYEAIQAGLADVEAGRYRPLDEIDAEMRARFGFARNDDDTDDEIE